MKKFTLFFFATRSELSLTILRGAVIFNISLRHSCVAKGIALKQLCVHQLMDRHC